MPPINIVTIDYKQYLSVSEISSIEHEVSIMETREAAGIEALRIVQEQRGWVSDESLYAIADLLNMPEAELEGVATFYNLIYRQEVGQFVIHLCDSIACHLTGYQQIYQAINTHLGIGYGQTTGDKKFTFLSNVCLGGCDKAPTMIIGKQHYQQLTPENVIDILNDLASQESEHD
ncbi:NADH-quinone oxidoreductase subunit NuoE [Colwellia hornerae]|uniref:NADH-quinone oxidoreductase subunit E n=2 Tax=Colwellia hornerae TaxID=89402 RepID=A0A5C6QPU0_9GAMM|nr:NADH-quinone oxidoreductase subunit NuoE [Colwellia hornerae]TWX56359.1 NADH-quinone oxidoreductase subunit NuoE [Colwellia hornerae]TWX62210.1 NADH-quinone oxidoreductase subunit NuoE [Colwellia hornerae]TWX70612.1 NADH-quinone oxidoreductase subunit NuoE [Colwellia hornerae]